MIRTKKTRIQIPRYQGNNIIARMHDMQRVSVTVITVWRYYLLCYNHASR